MLQLAFTHQLSADGRTLRLLDRTPVYNALTAPGGYGGPNPSAADVFFIAVVGRQQAGTLRFDATYYMQAGQLSFTLPGDGLFQYYVLAIAYAAVVPPTVPGQLWLGPGGLVYYADAGNVMQVFDLTKYSFEQLRLFTPPLLPVADFVGNVLGDAGSQVAVDVLLLEYARQGSRNRPQRGEDYAAHWLLALATLDSVRVLYNLGRYPEAAAQFGALWAMLTSCCPVDTLTRVAHTDWVAESQTR